jgi:hypothetical protein
MNHQFNVRCMQRLPQDVRGMTALQNAKHERSFRQMALMAWLLFVSLLLSPSLRAEQKVQLGDWDVHYIAMSSMLIEPAIAKQYGLKRANDMGLLNISVLASATQQAQQVELSGVAINLMQQRVPLTFTMVKDGPAIYYLAQLQHRPEEHYRLEITIKGSNSTQLLKFAHTFYGE